MHKRQTEPRAKPRTRAVQKSVTPRRAQPTPVKAVAQPAAKPAAKPVVKAVVKAVAKAAVKPPPPVALKPVAPARTLKTDPAKQVLRRTPPPPAPPPPVQGRKKLSKAAREAAAQAREAFLHSVIPTRIERLEILRQLYDKRREAPAKKEGAERPNEEEESEGEFVVSDEIVSSDSSEP